MYYRWWWGGPRQFGMFGSVRCETGSERIDHQTGSLQQSACRSRNFSCYESFNSFRAYKRGDGRGTRRLWIGEEPWHRQFNAVRRLPLRREVAWGGSPGLTHGTTWCVTARRDSAPVVGARPAFWHPVRGAGACGGGQPGVFASLDPRLISGSPSGNVPADGVRAPKNALSRMDTQRLQAGSLLHDGRPFRPHPSPLPRLPGGS